MKQQANLTVSDSVDQLTTQSMKKSASIVMYGRATAEERDSQNMGHDSMFDTNNSKAYFNKQSMPNLNSSVIGSKSTAELPRYNLS
jgi:hypothetical protein